MTHSVLNYYKKKISEVLTSTLVYHLKHMHHILYILLSISHSSGESHHMMKPE